MKKSIYRNNNAITFVCAGLLAVLGAACADGQNLRTVVALRLAPSDDDTSTGAAAPAAPAALPAPPALPAAADSPDQQQIVIQTVDTGGKRKQSKDVTWLGLAVGESSEALCSQLGLKPGEGLTVEFVAQESPAAKADFRKNDVLAELDDQMLVLPMQLRKLVQMHKEGDTVKLTYFRGGKKQTTSVKLGKTNWDDGNDKDDPAAPGDLDNLRIQLNGLNGQLRGMSQSIALAGLDKGGMNVEVNRTLKQTRKAIQDAVQRATINLKSRDDDGPEIYDLVRDGVDVDADATIVIRNKRNSNRTMLQTDETGTYIVEGGAKTHLTARDKHGKLLFDGEIDTPAEREKVPKEVWEKVEPMFNQITAPGDSVPKKDDDAGGK